MDINITEWALNSYLELVNIRTFNMEDYKKIIRPDVALLKDYPCNVKFSNGKFWSIATDRNGNKIIDGYKMKWHQMGDNLVQLRLTVGIIEGQAFLCEAYIKYDDKEDKRRLAKFKVYLDLIRKGYYTVRGKLS
ncbi:MAG: hypothetical protein V4501_02035 [Pseudomonadota bacterium]